MSFPAILVLEDGSIIEGKGFGAKEPSVGEIVFNTKMLDGTQKKLLDVSKIENLGWKHTITLKDGLKETYEWFLKK